MIQRLKHTTLLLFMFLLITGKNTLAQEPTAKPSFYFEILEMPNGQSGNHVQSIVQDTFGLMWFGSQYGLHRWDRYQFKTYMNDPEDVTSIASNYVEYIYIAKDGTLWLGVWGKGLNRFNYDTETFQRYIINPNDPNNKEKNTVSEIIEDRQGYLWLATSYGLIRFEPDTGVFKSFLPEPNNPNSLSHYICRTLAIDSEGTLWVGTGNPWVKDTKGGLNRYRPKTEDFVRYLNDPKDRSSLSNNKVSEIFEDSKGNFWIGTIGDGLHLMDRKTGKFQRLQQDPEKTGSLSGPFINRSIERHIRFVFEDQDQKIWIGAWEGGIKYYDPETGYIADYFAEEGNQQSLPEAFPWRMFQSKDGTLWGCTAQRRRKVFKIKENFFDYCPLDFGTDTEVNSFFETREHKVIVHTNSKPLMQFDLNTKELTKVNLNLRWPAVTSAENIEFDQSIISENMLTDNIWKMVSDEEGYLWFIKFNNQELLRIHPKSGEIKIYLHDPNDEKSISRGSITDILKDENNQIWLTTEYGELNMYNRAEDNFSHYKISAPNKAYTVLTQANDGNIVVTRMVYKNGNRFLLFGKFDLVTKEFIRLEKKIFSNSLTLNFLFLRNVLEDNLGNVWICLDSNLLKVEVISGEVTVFNLSHFGLGPLSTMLIDDLNRLWFFSNKIILFDPKSGIYSSYATSDNIKESPFYGRKAFKDSQGEFYFSTESGFQHFNPLKLGKKTTTVTLISEFQFLYHPNEKEVQKNHLPNILTSNKFYLNYNQNDFSLGFGTMSFLDSKTNRYEFLLEGYDKQWRSTGLEPKATYVNVPPGHYTFKVHGASQGSLWGPEKAINIYISPPWWASWWAYAFYALLAITLLYTFYRFQLNRNLDKEEAVRLKELDTVKTHLYTNITHEFRTPLTVISGMAAQIKENPKEWLGEGLDMIDRNTNRLLGLVNQMLDLSKLESGKIVLLLQQGEIITYLKYIMECMHSYAQSKNVKMHFYAEEEEIIMDFDPEKIQQVMTNLLSNAVKFTPSKGHVYVTVQKGQLPSERNRSTNLPTLQIKVRDTGLGISEEHIPFIFDRFYQVDDTATRHSEGSGIGLALVKKLVKLMDGNIFVKSKPGKETEFTVILPVKNEATELTVPAISTTSITAYTSITDSNSLSVFPGKEQKEKATQLIGSKPKILLIEDNPDVVAYIASCLQGNYEIQVGKNGHEGIEIAIENIPDLIVTDVMMPIKDGFEVCKTLKKDERTSHIPIIILTAKADLKNKLKGLEKGADAYLSKPFDKKELNIRIKKLLELRKKLQQYYLSITGLVDYKAEANGAPKIDTVENRFMEKVKKTITTHLNDFNFNVAQFCNEIGMSQSQLHRKLTALTGLSPNRFIRHVRLYNAKDLLQNPDTIIATVAYDTGFNDPGYFSRVFKKEFGMTPLEWKEKGHR